MTVCSVIPVIISRFLLNLRQVVHKDQPDSHFSRFSALNFRVPDSLPGNTGESLELTSSADAGDSVEAHFIHDEAEEQD